MKSQQVKTEWGVSREREREREEWINGVRDRMLDRNGNGVGWKCPLVEDDTWVFLVKEINIMNRVSIRRDKSWFGLKFFHFTGASTFVLMTPHFTTGAQKA